MADLNLYYLPGVESSESAVSTPQSVSGASSGNQGTNSNQQYVQQDKLVSRVETLEKYVETLKSTTVKTDSNASLSSLDVKDKLTANFGKLGGWDINAGKIETNKIEIDSNNERIRSKNYVPGVSGFSIDSNLIEADNLVARGTMRGTTFQYDVVSAVGGQLLVTNADSLKEPMSQFDASLMVTKNTTTFAANDILLIQDINPATGSGILTEYVRVTAVSGGTLTVTRDLAGAYSADLNPAWREGTAVVKVGNTNGSSTYSGGWLRLIGEGTNSPYYSVFKRNGTSYNSFVEALRIGNLNGFLDYASDEYGIAIGDSTGNLTYDPTNGLRLRGTSSNFFEIVVSDNLQTSADANSDFNNSTYTKKKEILFNDISGNIRVKFDIVSLSAPATTAYGRIYKNGVAVGTERTNGTGTPATYSEDFAVSSGDLIQLYGKNSDGVGSVRLSNFRIYYDKQVKAVANTVNLN